VYRFIRPLFWQLSPEKAHRVALALLNYIPSFFFKKIKPQPRTVMGIDFPHPVGLAAGFDNNAQYLDALAKLNFAFIEVGGVTPHAQRGNPKPRLFRLPEVHGLINRMGFENRGVDALIQRLERVNYQGILGINIAKNKQTRLEDASTDYIVCMQKLYPYASYLTINISSPNMPNLRDLQKTEYFFMLMSSLCEEQRHLSDIYGKHVPLVVKLSPDESDEALKRMAHVLVSLGVDGVIATNTTVNRDMVHDLRHGLELGGLSGRPLASRATDCVKLLRREVGNTLAIISSGGIDNPVLAKERVSAGADLLQIYTGLIYEGPALVKILTEALASD
jgi:dihydroorotate dehydrogenase